MLNINLLRVEQLGSSLLRMTTYFALVGIRTQLEIFGVYEYGIVDILGIIRGGPTALN